MIAVLSEIEERVHSKITELVPSPDRIRFEVAGGLVTVSGIAPADQADELCAALRRIEGVDEVENRIEVFSIRDH